MLAFGWASIMLAAGTLLRAKLPFLRNMLVPASVVAGILGIVFINVLQGCRISLGTDTDMFSVIVNNLFTVSFISISLTSTPKDGDNGKKHVIQGAVGMGIVWCILYALTPVVGVGIITLFGKGFGMDSIYGMLIPFAFCQGPGQAVTYGTIFEQYGWKNAGMVAVGFASVGFIVAFLVGIPAAKYGIKRGIAKNCGRIDLATLRGYYHKEEQTDYMVKDTTCSSNIETLTYHFMLIGVCYVLAVGIGKVLSCLPGFLGPSLGGMMFMNGMYAAYLVKWTMKKLHIDFLQENILQGKITGWTADYLVICAFMSVQSSVLKAWLWPIVLEAVVVTVVTFVVCFYFGQRFGGSNDFERTLGLFGTCTGTVPSGIALVRILDPQFQTTTSVELGLMNLVMLLCTPTYLIILAAASGTVGVGIAVAGLLGCCAVYLVLLRVVGAWKKKTYHWR